MTISEYIAHLEGMKAQHGDLEVETVGLHFERETASKPVVAYRKILGKRERSSKFYSSYDPLDQRGEKVCRI